MLGVQRLTKNVHYCVFQKQVIDTVLHFVTFMAQQLERFLACYICGSIDTAVTGRTSGRLQADVVSSHQHLLPEEQDGIVTELSLCSGCSLSLFLSLFLYPHVYGPSAFPSSSRRRSLCVCLVCLRMCPGSDQRSPCIHVLTGRNRCAARLKGFSASGDPERRAHTLRRADS